MFGKMRRRRISVMIVSISVAIALIASSCSLGSMPSKTSSSDTSSDETSDTCGVITDSSISGNSSSSDDLSATETGDHSLDYKLKEQAEKYMAVLSSGDLQGVMDYYKIIFREIMDPVYVCYEDVFRTLFSDLEYSYGAIFTTNNIDYDLTVTCKVPDIDACVDTVFADTEFMKSAASDWVTSIVADYESMETVYAFERMKNSILLEALRRIEEGEFTEKLMITGSFRFHDNGGKNDWVCIKTPDFVKRCARDYYMMKLVNIHPVMQLDLIRLTGESLIADGTIKQKAFDDFISAHESDFLET